MIADKKKLTKKTTYCSYFYIKKKCVVIDDFRFGIMSTKFFCLIVNFMDIIVSSLDEHFFKLCRSKP